MAFNIVDPAKIVKQIPTQFQKDFAELLKKKKFPKNTFFGEDKSTSKGYKVKVTRNVLKKEKESHIIGKGYTINFKATRLGPTDKPVAKQPGALDATSIQEQMSALYTSIRFNSKSDLTEKNCDFEEVMTDSIAGKCFFDGNTPQTKKSAMQLYSTTSNHPKVSKWLIPDKEGGQNIFMKSANAIYNHKSTTNFKNPVYIHRGSSFMKAIYQSFKTAQAEQMDPKNGRTVWTTNKIDENKWNPGDIWISTLNPNPESSKPFCYGQRGGGDCKTYDMLKDSVREAAENGKILGISLKKTEGGSATVTEFNLAKRKHNKKTLISYWSFGKTGDFFASKDMYLHFNNGNEMQFKPGEIASRWRGEVTGGSARGGNMSGAITNFFCEKFMRRSIGGSIKGEGWHERQYYNADINKMWSLYKKYINHSKNKFRTSKIMKENDFKKMVKKQAKGFAFSKYMSLLFIDALYGGGGDLTMCSTKMMRYAQSNLDISTYFIKVS